MLKVSNGAQIRERMMTMNRKEALAWIAEQSEDEPIDDDDLDSALRALGYDPDSLRGDDEDPTDRRWDVACSELEADFVLG